MGIQKVIAAMGIGAMALSIAACEGKLPGKPTDTASSKDKTPKNVSIGQPLFTPEESKTTPRPSLAGNQAEPIIITGAQLTIPSSENVPTKNNGTVWQICTELKPGQTADPKDVFTHPTTKKQYRRLREGDAVAAGDLVAMLDDQVARAKYNAALTDKAAADDMLTASNVVEEKARKTFEIYKKDPSISSKIETYKAEQEWATTQKQAADAKGSRDKAVESLNIAKVSLDDHELRTSIGGVVSTIYVKPGEAVKEQTPVLMIQSLDTLRAEGLMPVHHQARLPNARGKKAFLEPSAQLSPEQELIGHWNGVTSVAISKDARKPLIVSGGEDKFVRVWERATRTEKAHVQSDAPIRAVACTGSKSQANLALFGGDDGQGQILDLDGLTEVDVKARKLATRHRNRINAVAFTPDGTQCLTADGKEVIVHDVATGNLKYRFMTDHRGPMTSIQVTPQAKLLTTAQDKTMRLWDLGETGAKLNAVIDNRSGNVDVLGVSPDGQKVLFDQERALHVRGIYDQRTDAVMNSPTESSQFSTFAIFSPDSQMVVAAGTADNPLGVWRLPGPGANRAFQRVRLAIGNTNATCAAISPDNNFVAVGTSDHRVLVFARPDNVEMGKQYPATITFLAPDVNSEHKMRLWVETTPSPGMPLLPGDLVTIVIPAQ